MADHVTIFDHRITYLPGQVTTGTPDTGFVACGSGTAYPLLVTLDQLAEIMYRVRDCSATGEIILEQRKPDISAEDGETFLGWLGSGVSNFYTYTFFNDLSENLCEREGTYDFFCATERGYFANDEVIPAFAESFFGTAYSVTDFNYSPSLIEVREAVSELAMWVPTDPLGFEWGAEVISATWGGSVSLFSCGFTFASGSNFYYGGYLTPPAFHCFAVLVDQELGGVRSEYYIGSSMRLTFSGVVTYVGDSPTDPGAQLYVGLDFDAAYGPLTSLGGPEHTSVCDLVFQLSASSVSCPLYLFTSLVDYGEDIEDEYILYSATDFVFTATEWWPYAHPVTGLPVWDTATGLPA